jgi:hypothetical protein
LLTLLPLLLLLRLGLGVGAATPARAASAPVSPRAGPSCRRSCTAAAAADTTPTRANSPSSTTARSATRLCASRVEPGARHHRLVIKRLVLAAFVDGRE